MYREDLLGNDVVDLVLEVLGGRSTFITGK
jgi:hypothetical protein